MKRLLYLLFAATLFTSCSSDDDPVISQDYTSFTVVHNEDVILYNSVAAYKKDSKYVKIASLGDLKKGVPSAEIKVTDASITEIYLFTDYSGARRFDAIYSLKKNTKNSITIAPHTKGISVTDKTDPTQYPQ